MQSKIVKKKYDEEKIHKFIIFHLFIQILFIFLKYSYYYLLILYIWWVYFCLDVYINNNEKLIINRINTNNYLNFLLINNLKYNFKLLINVEWTRRSRWLTNINPVVYKEDIYEGYVEEEGDEEGDGELDCPYEALLNVCIERNYN